MSRGLSTLQSSSALDEHGAGRFFFSNFRMQETLTTIRYGIEARKGLVLITGEAGIGKTTLLHKVAADLSDNVTSIVLSDPRVSFYDVLQDMLQSFGLESVEADEQAMVRICQHELRARLERYQIVALMFDNAHHLSESTLRHVFKNFLGGSAEDPDGTLVQLILAGQPGLTSKLAQAALLPLRRRTPIVSELQPLSSQEIASYIEHELRSNNHSERLFDPRAVKRIALYSKGNPRSINAICERAVEVADGSAGTLINAERIDEIVRELNFFRESIVASEPINEREFVTTDKSDESDPVPSAPPKDYAKVLEAVGQTFLDSNWGDERQAAPRHATRKSAWISIMLVVIVLGGAGVWMDNERARDALASWNGMINGFVVRLQELRAGSRESEAAPESRVDTAPGETLPRADSYPYGKTADGPSQSAFEPATGNNGVERSRGAKSQSIGPSLPNQERRAPLKAALKQPSNQELQLQIIKAIENRAIMGVEVTVDRGVAYLDGRVASQRQRRAAERAAHSVAGVARVRNRIVID